MKKILAALVALVMLALPASSMSYEQARREALFLTDKMAYELNLTPEQYDAAYEINLDYLMGVTSVDNVFSTYWTRRNLDMSYILLNWQWDAFCAATYFYRPLYWADGFWRFGIYARYPRRDYFYFARPTVYITYRGGHSWHHNGGRSYYHSHRDNFHASKPHDNGLRTKWDRGEFKGNRAGTNSSTRVTVNRDNSGNAAGNHSQGTFRVSSDKGTTSGTATMRPQNSSTNQGNSSFRIQRQQSGGTSSSSGLRSSSTSKSSGTTLRSSSSSSSQIRSNVRSSSSTGTLRSRSTGTTASPSRSSSTVRSSSTPQRSSSAGTLRSSGSSSRSSSAGTRSSSGSSSRSGGSSQGGSFRGSR